MMDCALPTHLQFKPPNLRHQILHTQALEIVTARVSTSARGQHASSFSIHHHRHRFNPKFHSIRPLLTRACGDAGGGGGACGDATPQHSTTTTTTTSGIPPLKGGSMSGEGYVGLFVRKLGLDNDPMDREQAVVALWKYSLGGKQYIDEIMQFRGAINLTVNLLKSESTAACEAAAGILRMISTVNEYRDLVVQSGAIEEITGLLTRSSLNSDVKEQSICALSNLSVDEKLREKIANSDLLPLLIKCLEDERINVMEAAAGVLTNLALSHSNHRIMVEAGIIPKLAELLTADADGSKGIRNMFEAGDPNLASPYSSNYAERFIAGAKASKVIRKLAENVLLELAKDEYYRILVMEEGLVLVPLIGAAAYKSFSPPLYTWPSLPDGTEFKRTSTKPSEYGAGELLLGLNREGNNFELEEAKLNALKGRTKQHFLASHGIIEIEDENRSNNDESCPSQRITVLPWIDGVARLVLILGLEDESSISRAAESIADASISEHMRVSFKEAGAVNHLVRLIDHNNDNARFSVIRALERLSMSTDVCKRIEAQGVLIPLINSLKHSEISESLTDLILNILARILDPSKEMKSKVYDGPVKGSKAAGNVDEISVSKLTSSLQSSNVEDVLDSEFLAWLIGIMKMSSPNLQRKAASILEFVTVIESSCVEKIISADIESGLDVVFQQKILYDVGTESDLNNQRPELRAVEVEEAGLAISAASHLFTRLLDFEKFCQAINSSHFTQLLRKILKSSIPLRNKDYVAACLVKLSSILGPNLDLEYPINAEVMLYETVPRLLEQIESSFSPEVQEAAVVELNRIISEGVVDSTRAVAGEGGIFPLVKLIEGGSETAVEAGLAILYNLSMDGENHSAIIAAGAVPVLKKIVLLQRPQWTRALHLLRTLPT
ncbi:hypothetical protein LguiA_000679 [Lonicera macranthoides]